MRGRNLTDPSKSSPRPPQCPIASRFFGMTCGLMALGFLCSHSLLLGLPPSKLLLLTVKIPGWKPDRKAARCGRLVFKLWE